MPESEAAGILRKYSKENIVVSTPDTRKVTGFLQKQFDEWDKVKRPVPCATGIPPEFSREDQAKKLGFVLDKILNKDCLR